VPALVNTSKTFPHNNLKVFCEVVIIWWYGIVIIPPSNLTSVPVIQFSWNLAYFEALCVLNLDILILYFYDPWVTLRRRSELWCNNNWFWTSIDFSESSESAESNHPIFMKIGLMVIELFASKILKFVCIL
jgi:hypothetical protein